MSALSLRLPNSLHARARELAEREGISLNQFVSTAVAEKLAALLTEEYLGARARRGSRVAYQKALGNVPDAPPAPGDELESGSGSRDAENSAAAQADGQGGPGVAGHPKLAGQMDLRSGPWTLAQKDHPAPHTRPAGQAAPCRWSADGAQAGRGAGVGQALSPTAHHSARRWLSQRAQANRAPGWMPFKPTSPKAPSATPGAGYPQAPGPSPTWLPAGSRLSWRHSRSAQSRSHQSRFRRPSSPRRRLESASRRKCQSRSARLPPADHTPWNRYALQPPWSLRLRPVPSPPQG
ncbi:MAG: toxin-antitoxin system HicB family antitoxin [Gemmatimonadetes bacterium]|nr:toxin-antitoxin system HicB family antitoxin [Gemmatimonadota bacterium]